MMRVRDCAVRVVVRQPWLFADPDTLTVALARLVSDVLAVRLSSRLDRVGQTAPLGTVAMQVRLPWPVLMELAGSTPTGPEGRRLGSFAAEVAVHDAASAAVRAAVEQVGLDPTGRPAAAAHADGAGVGEAPGGGRVPAAPGARSGPAPATATPTGRPSAPHVWAEGAGARLAGRLLAAVEVTLLSAARLGRLAHLLRRGDPALVAEWTRILGSAAGRPAPAPLAPGRANLPAITGGDARPRPATAVAGRGRPGSGAGGPGAGQARDAASGGPPASAEVERAAAAVLDTLAGTASQETLRVEAAVSVAASLGLPVSDARVWDAVERRLAVRAGHPPEAGPGQATVPPGPGPQAATAAPPLPPASAPPGSSPPEPGPAEPTAPGPTAAPGSTATPGPEAAPGSTAAPGSSTAPEPAPPGPTAAPGASAAPGSGPAASGPAGSSLPGAMAAARPGAAPPGAAWPHSGGGRPPVRRELEVASVLPFLLIGPLDDLGVLDAVAAALAGPGWPEPLAAFAGGLARKALPPPADGWLQAPTVAATVAAFAGQDEPPDGVHTERLGQTVQRWWPVIEEVLIARLVDLRTPGSPLVVTGSPGGLVTASADGLAPLLWDADPAAVQRLWDRCGRPPLLTDAGAPGPLAELRAGDGGGLAEPLAELVALAGERPAGGRPGLAPELDGPLGLLAGVALAALAWQLWDRHGERTHPALALRRLGDLDGSVRLEPDRIGVTMPLGRRHADLRDSGLLRSVDDVPWLHGRRLELEGG